MNNEKWCVCVCVCVRDQHTVHDLREQFLTELCLKQMILN